MKRILLMSMGCLVTAMLYAQSSTTVYTPKGTAVSAQLYNEMTTEQIDDTNQLAANQYPLANRLANSSTQYNCHAYAWHLTEGNTNRVWISDPGDEKYWQDGSFIRVCNESQSTKISYPNGDHSAIRSTQSIPLGRYDSKWGQWPLLRHTPTYTPYNSTSLQYYVSTKVNGPTSVTTSSVGFTTAAAPITGATYTWTKSSNVILTGSGTGVLARAVAGTNGTGWVQVAVNSPCGGTVTTRKNVTVVGNSQVTITGTSSVCNGQAYTYTANPPGGQSSSYTYTWTYPSGWNKTSQLGNQVTLYIPTTNSNYGTVAVAVTGFSTVGLTVLPSYSCGGFLTTGGFTIYPNPADEQLTIEQTENAPSNTQIVAVAEQLTTVNAFAKTATPAFRVELLNSQQVVVAKGTAQDERVSLDTKSLLPGVYFLQIYRDNAVLQEQIVIE